MAVVVDAMGGDHAPAEIVAGAVEASREFGVEVVLVGNKAILGDFDIDSPLVSLEHAETTIGMNEHPVKALRKKPDSSIAITCKLVKERPGTALLSAGHTGAVMAGALLGLGRISGIERPGIAAIVPTEKGNVVVLDVGANVDCKPHHLAHFAIMGTAYAKHVLHIDNPSVGLLNIGTEEKKGNELTLAAFAILQSSQDITFVGNIEPEDVYRGHIDVVVTDGFAGNVFLKTSEGVSNLIQKIVRSELERAPNTMSSLRETLFSRLNRYSTRNPRHAGAPLLGVNAPCVITHGGSRARTIKHCVVLAEQFAKSDALDFIKNHVNS